jgi:hypothetical protein
MHRRVPWRGVPLPCGSSLRGLADASCPSLGSSRQRRSWGSSRSSQVCSRMRVMHHLWRIGPTCRLHSASARLIFVGLISPLIRVGRMRASNRAVNRGLTECPASGLRSRLRSVPSFFFSLGKRSCHELCPLAGLRSRAKRAFGRARPRPDRQPQKAFAGFFAAALFIRSWVCRLPQSALRGLRAGDSLQRVLGLTPCRSRRFRVRQARLPV